MIARRRHLKDQRLFDCYVAARGGDALDPPAAEHLADCPACEARYADLARFMDDVRAEAEDDTDAAFPAEQLRAQQHEIARRIEHIGHAARVISFPGPPATHQAARSAVRLAPRWIAGAAAAGLFIGIYVGTFVDSGRLLGRGRAAASIAALGSIASGRGTLSAPIAGASGRTGAMDAAGGLSVSSGADSGDQNDQFLSELELALERPHYSELAALDELTPHVRPVRTVLH